jgi:hypothetical protein
VEKLKRGESIGPVTKAALEEDAKEEKDKEEKDKEEKDKEEKDKEEKHKEEKDKKEKDKEEKKEEKEQTSMAEKQDNDKDKEQVVGKDDEPAEPHIDSAPDSPASTIREIPIREKRTPQKTSEAEDSSDTHSTDSEIPSTPDSTDTASSTAEAQPEDLIEANNHETKEIRSIDSIATVDKAISSTPEIVEPEKIETATQVDIKPFEAMPLTHVEVIVPLVPEENKTMEGWEMLQMVVSWIRHEFLADEDALARQLANKEISYRFLWLYYVPGSLISLQDPISKQQMAARVHVFK